MISPYELSILIHHYTSPADFPSPSPMYSQVLERLVSEGVLIKADTIILTPLGEAWLTVILQTPLPRQVFVDIEGREIIKE